MKVWVLADRPAYETKKSCEKAAESSERCIPLLGYLPYDWERND